MRAYHSDPTLKTRVLAELATHEAADRLLQDYGYWRADDSGAYRGCGVGCSLESLRAVMGLETIDHKDYGLYESLVGVPRVLATLKERLFEHLSPEVARQLPRRFLEAIQPGADLSMVFARWMRAVHAEPGGVQAAVAQRPALKPSVDGIIALYDRWLAGDRPSVEEWRAARYDAAEAADTAAYAATDAAAAEAARAAAAAYADAAATARAAVAAAEAYAAYAAAGTAAEAAYDAADATDADADDARADADYAAAAAAEAARATEVQRQADLLIRCLREAPVIADAAAQEVR
jgi:hypothetical protein